MKLPDRSKIASFDVDSQNTFTPRCPNELPVPGGEEIATELNAQAQFACVRMGSKDAHSPRAVWVADPQHPVGSPVEGEAGRQADVHWPVHAVPGTPGFELIAGLPPITDYDFFVWKGIELNMHPYGACFHDIDENLSTGVIEFCRARGIETMIVGGLALEYCVKTTVLQLLKHGFDVIVNLAACRGLDEAAMAEAKQEMEEAGARFVERASEISLSMPPKAHLTLDPAEL